MPGQKQDRLFARPLTEVLAIEKNQVPAIVTLLIKHIESSHIDSEGLYWRGVAATDLVVLKKGFDKIGVALPDPAVLQTPEAATSLLKSFFRELPEPLLTHKLFTQFVETNSPLSHVSPVPRPLTPFRRVRYQRHT